MLHSDGMVDFNIGLPHNIGPCCALDIQKETINLYANSWHDLIGSIIKLQTASSNTELLDLEYEFTVRYHRCKINT